MVSSHSVDKTTKEIGGDLGWITPENYPIPEIEFTSTTTSLTIFSYFLLFNVVYTLNNHPCYKNY